MTDVEEVPLDEVLKHNTKEDLWIIIHHNVYNVSTYLEDHPGGLDSLLEVAGQNATIAFEDVGHSLDARETMASFFVGRLAGTFEEDDDEGKHLSLPHPDLSIIPKDQDFNSEHPVITTGRFAVKIALFGATMFLGYEAYARAPKIGWMQSTHGGFWRGVLLSTVATLSLVTGAGLWLEKSMAKLNKTPYSYPPHFRIKSNIIPAPITKSIGFLKPEEYQKIALVQKEKLSPNTYRFTFALPSPDMILGLPIGQHISIRAMVDGKMVSRSYTPISGNEENGVLRLVVKIYEGGALTGGYLRDLEVGGTVEVRGPKGAMRWRRGMLDGEGQGGEGEGKGGGRIGAVCGGTGITPIFQIIKAICLDPLEKTTISLLYANNSEQDILLRHELDFFASTYPQKFSVRYVLSHAREGWEGDRGFVTRELIEDEIVRGRFPKAEGRGESKVLLCGPPGLVEAMKGTLVELEWPKARAVSRLSDSVFCF